METDIKIEACTNHKNKKKITMLDHYLKLLNEIPKSFASKTDDIPQTQTL